MIIGYLDPWGIVILLSPQLRIENMKASRLPCPTVSGIRVATTRYQV